MAANTDVAFTIGSTHKICQDYAMCGQEPMPWALIADGCSGAPMSDFGARIIASSVVPHMHHENKEVFCYSVLAEATSRCRTLGLPENAISSTLFCITFDEEDFRVRCIGDGFIAALNHEGRLDVFEIKFNRNAPFYLYYEQSKELKDTYFEKFGNKYSISANGGQELEKTIPSDGIFCEEFVLPAYQYKMVAVMSDGMNSFFKSVDRGTGILNEYASSTDMAKELLSFKNYAGEFVQRRMNKAIQKLEGDGYKHYDDVSVGAIVTL